MIWRAISIGIIVCVKNIIIDKILYLCYILSEMKKVKHTSLTHILRHDVWMTLPRLKKILNDFDVSPDLGGLPPALCACVAPGDRSAVTGRFHELIVEFISENRLKLLSPKTVMTRNWVSVAELFGTPCVVECRNRAVGEDMPWRGAIAVVCRISFPEIGAIYALKVFRRDDYKSAHGPWVEIPAAFGAYAAEPKDNNPIRMASLGDVKYMLSEWAGEDGGRACSARKNLNEIFFTADMEMHSGNFRNGRRIDYGRTYKTAYGSASYNVRKLYRKLMLAGQNGDVNAVQQIIESPKNAFAKKDVDRAIELAQSLGSVVAREHIARCVKAIR